MANCGLLLNDGSSFVLLNDGASAVLLNDNSCAFEPGQGGQSTDNKGGGGYIGGTWSKGQWRTLVGELQAEELALRRKRQRELEREEAKLAAAVAQAEAQFQAALQAEQQQAMAQLRTMRLQHAQALREMAELLPSQIANERLREAIARQAQEDADDEEALMFLVSRDRPN